MKNINTKFAALNLVKAAMIVLLILSCISFAGCGKTDEVDTDKVGTLIQWFGDGLGMVWGWFGDGLGMV